MDKFTLRVSWLLAVESLAPAECGRLLVALLKYAQDQEPQNLCGREKKVFGEIAREIDAERLCKNAQTLCKSARYINNNNSTIQSSEDDIKNKLSLSLADKFEVFWKAYPTHVNRKRCIPLWEKIDPDDELLAKMLESIAAWKKTRQWIEGYIPNPDTWLRNEKWEDDVPPPPRKYNKAVHCGSESYEQHTVRMEDLSNVIDFTDPKWDSDLRQS